ncbi:hypothetical protein BSU04_43870 [Caballeronia sordidicola]|uniref:Uncharacterized protein n=1 Tax=Caballeronia sordidicola TaxID=196367 RepID=A0A226WMT0_CABSO|nr:hypothetical protein BSU04_43870 [Caballeronia sordidicola]
MPADPTDTVFASLATEFALFQNFAPSKKNGDPSKTNRRSLTHLIPSG